MTSRRALLALLWVVALFVVSLVAAHHYLRPIANAPPLIRPAPIVEPYGTVIEGVVSKYEVAKSGVVVEAVGTHVLDKIWLVKLDDLSAIRGEIPEKSLTLLVHSPSMDLGVRERGQRIRIGLMSAARPLEIIVPPSRRGRGDLPDLSRVKYEVTRGH